MDTVICNDHKQRILIPGLFGRGRKKITQRLVSIGQGIFATALGCREVHRACRKIVGSMVGYRKRRQEDAIMLLGEQRHFSDQAAKQCAVCHTPTGFKIFVEIFPCPYFAKPQSLPVVGKVREVRPAAIKEDRMITAVNKAPRQRGQTLKMLPLRHRDTGQRWKTIQQGFQTSRGAIAGGVEVGKRHGGFCQFREIWHVSLTF